MSEVIKYYYKSWWLWGPSWAHTWHIWKLLASSSEDFGKLTLGAPEHYQQTTSWEQTKSSFLLDACSILGLISRPFTARQRKSLSQAPNFSTSAVKKNPWKKPSAKPAQVSSTNWNESAGEIYNVTYKNANHFLLFPKWCSRGCEEVCNFFLSPLRSHQRKHLDIEHQELLLCDRGTGSEAGSLKWVSPTLMKAAG